MQAVALMGLGTMGSGMAANLLKKGFPVTVYNRTRAKAEVLVAQGARLAETPRQAAAASEVIISMVGDDAASRAIWTGTDGALAGARAGSILIECSTLSPRWVVELAAMAKEHHCPFLDSPVAGSRDAAAAGTLRLFVGGDPDTLNKARPVLEALGSSIAHLGPIGAGATMKLINNMMVAVHMVTVSEGLVLAERSGLDMQQVNAAILNGATSSPIVKGKLERLTSRRYENADFALRWMTKDASYAIDLAADFDLPVKTVVAAYEVLRAECDRGGGDADVAVVIEALRAHTPR
ncbi:MAG TPA: NAD(P)-dependent oxidoreductase [Aggregatilineales bacterium]|nr:NAD(P)-dependent oxidoreductase [Aggregatilineales bacterium]